MIVKAFEIIYKRFVRILLHIHNFWFTIIRYPVEITRIQSYGHHVGDRALQAVASRLLSSICKTDTAFRKGGDEFAIIAEGENIEESYFVAEKILGAFAHPFMLDGIPINISFSTHINMFPEDGDDLDILLTYTEKAMHRAKLTGTCYRFHTSPNRGF